MIWAEEYDGGVHTSAYLYLYGDGAEAMVARDAPAWRAWMERRAAAPAPSG